MTILSSLNNATFPNALISYIPDFYSQNNADNLFHKIRENTAWQSYKIKIYGKVYDQPRLTAFYNETKLDYGYSKIKLKSEPFNVLIHSINHEIFSKTGYKFNSVLLNYYRDGADSNGWHADNEKALGHNPIIASLSLGVARMFEFRHNILKTERHKILLENGSLLLMEGEMQHFWKHQIPKTNKIKKERINLTFRNL